jgi:hypothetical protein
MRITECVSKIFYIFFEHGTSGDVLILSRKSFLATGSSASQHNKLLGLTSLLREH